MNNVLKITAAGELKVYPVTDSAWGVAKRELGNATLEPLGLAKGLVMLLDEDGYGKGLPMNERATALVAKCYGGDVRPILGDVILALDNGETYKPLTDQLEILARYFFYWLPKIKMPSKMPEPTITIFTWK